MSAYLVHTHTTCVCAVARGVATTWVKAYRTIESMGSKSKDKKAKVIVASSTMCSIS